MCFNVYLHNLQFVMAIVSIYLHKHFVVREHFHVDLQSVRLVRVEFALSRFIEARASFHVDHQHRQKQANIHACIHTSMQTYIHIYTNVHAGELVLFLNPCRTMVQQKIFGSKC